MPRFVIREGHATDPHFDPRLGRDGLVHVPGAVPKAMPEDAREYRLAVRVEDHAPSQMDVVDERPVEGVPGAEKKSIWNGGDYEAGEFGEEMVVVRLRGGRLDGRCAILRTGRKSWMVHKIRPFEEAPGEARD